MDLVRFFGLGIGLIVSDHPIEVLTTNGFGCFDLVAGEQSGRYYFLSDYYTSPTKFEKSMFEDPEISDITSVVLNSGSEEFKSRLDKLKQEYERL